MTVLRAESRPGHYCDSIVLMQLQGALAELPGVRDAAAVMGTAENLALLRTSGLLPESLAPVPGASDLLVAVKADSEEAAAAALGKIGELLARRRGAERGDYRPRSLASAAAHLPAARWVLVSVPGRWASRVAREALELGRHVFMFSDNVALEDEVALKRQAADRGLLVMGPDCGTAMLNGVGFGFANRVRRGGIGLVGASGTGLQAVATHIHGAGEGISHAIGTGSRDLTRDVGAVAARQGLELLGRDPGTQVVVFISKPPEPEVARRVLGAARETGKPFVVYFQGYSPAASDAGDLWFATSLGDAASRAVALLRGEGEAEAAGDVARDGRAMAAAAGTAGGVPDDYGAPSAGNTNAQATAGTATGGPWLRGLFTGGTLASEALLSLRGILSPLHSNIASEGTELLPEATYSRAHTILDLGADEFTLGRLHPMIDPELRLERLAREAVDPEVGALLLDVVLGDGAHPDPAAVLAPAIEAATQTRRLHVVALLIGTEEDPQDLERQAERLRQAGAHVVSDLPEALNLVYRRLGTVPRGRARPTEAGARPAPAAGARPDSPGSSEDLRAEVPESAPPARVELADIESPVAAINVGLETFYESLIAQGAEAVQVEWRPPAGGDEKLLAILDRLRG